MKELYLDIMEWSMAAYDDARIRRYVDQVREEGLTEHGFPRLGANMGILMAHGRWAVKPVRLHPRYSGKKRAGRYSVPFL